MKTGKELAPSEVSLELLAANRKVLILVVAEIYQKVLDIFGWSDELALSIVVPTRVLESKKMCWCETFSGNL